MGAKLRGLAKQRGSRLKRAIFQHHLVASFPPSTRFNSQDPIKQAIEVLKPLLRKMNVDTGYVIFHPYRIKKEHRGDVLGHKSGDGSKGWKDILGLIESSDRSFEGIRDEYLVYAPHFHILGLSDYVDLQQTEGIEERTGIVIHRIEQEREDGKKRSIANLEELCRATAYSLSHTGLEYDQRNGEYRAAVRPFGEVANFEAWDKEKRKVKAAMRSVAPKVLGIEFPRPKCSERIVDEDATDVREGVPSAVRSLGWGVSGSPATDELLARAWGTSNDTRDSWDTTAGYIPPSAQEPSPETTSKCSGKLLPM